MTQHFLPSSLDGLSTISIACDVAPPDEAVSQAVLAAHTELADAFANTKFEALFEQISMRLTSTLHRMVEYHERLHSDACSKIRELSNEQDGSEVQSGRLEDALASANDLDETVELLSLMRDTMARNHMDTTGSAWRPVRGSKTTRHTATSAMIEGRDYLKHKANAESLRKAPQGTLIAVSGTKCYTDVKRAFSLLDAALKSNPDMILVTGGQNLGIDKIATGWAVSRKVDIIVEKPNFGAFSKKQAPFKRNDAILKMGCAAVMVFVKEGDPNGVALNLFQKATDRGVTARKYLQKAS